VGDGCKVGAQRRISGNIKEESATWLGFSGVYSKLFLRSFAHFTKLVELNKKVDELTKLVESLKNS
jgi:UDP-3-O-[3-hydroxymyristoyl] glucosamine N-acyltransferase